MPYPGPSEQVIPEQIRGKNSFTVFTEPRAASVRTTQDNINSGHNPHSIFP